MKKEIVPYTIRDLHFTIDYLKLIQLQAMAFSETIVAQKESRQKIYSINSTHRQNQRQNRNRESSGINPRKEY